MKIGELLRQVADAVDAQEMQADKIQQAQQATQQSELATAVQAAQELQAGQVAQLTQAAQNVKQATELSSSGTPELTSAPPEESDCGCDTELTSVNQTDETDSDSMVPPLQQKHELLKKATGVENNVDEFAANDDAELAQMMRIAGIQSDSPQEQEINPRRTAALLHFSSDNVEVE